MTSVFWFFLTVIVPLLLLGALYWEFWRNRPAPDARRVWEHPEEGARHLRREIATDSRYREN